MRVARFLALAGIASRRKSEELITKGLVMVNGTVHRNLGAPIDPENDVVQYKGKRVTLKKYVYYKVHKPIGYVSTTRDPHATKRVIDLVPKGVRVVPVGRLDKDSSGLILLTNDGDLVHKLTHPKFEVEKEYEVVLDRQVTPQMIQGLKKGVRFKEGMVYADRVTKHGSRILHITIHEGKNRQLRRMIGALGARATKLVRVREGKVKIGNLKSGDSVRISRSDIV